MFQQTYLMLGLMKMTSVILPVSSAIMMVKDLVTALFEYLTSMKLKFPKGLCYQAR